MTEVLAIVNPAAGGGRCGSVRAARARPAAGGRPDVDWRRPQAPVDAIAARARGLRGGRAPVHRRRRRRHRLRNRERPVARGARRRPEERPCLGFLPLGTGNSFLRDFGSERCAACGRRRCASAGASPATWCGWLTPTASCSSSTLLSVGFVADVDACANRRFKALGPAGLRRSVVLVETASLAPRPWHMQVDGGEWHEPVLFASFCNSRFTGGKMMMAPFADSSDGQLDVIVASARWGACSCCARSRDLQGTHVHIPAVAHGERTRGVRGRPTRST